jgi:hypothetical protein
LDQWVIRNHETKYSPQSTKAENTAAFGDLPSRNILMSVRTAPSVKQSKAQGTSLVAASPSGESAVSHRDADGIG